MEKNVIQAMIQGVLVNIFKTLPTEIGESGLTVRFFDPLAALVLYRDELGNEVQVSHMNVDLYNEFDRARMFLDLVAAYPKETIMKVRDEGIFRINVMSSRMIKDMDRIARDILLIFDTLPTKLYSHGGKFHQEKVTTGQTFVLYVDVEIPIHVDRISWFVRYVDDQNRNNSLPVSFAKDGKDDDVDYWFQNELSAKDLLWGLKNELGLDLRREEQGMSIHFVSDPKVQIHMWESLGIPKERALEIAGGMDAHRKELIRDNTGRPMSLDEAFNAVYTRASKGCRNNNELFYVGYLCGQQA